MSWKSIDRTVYSMLGLSSAAVVSALVAVALLIAGPPPMWSQSEAPTPPVVLKRLSTPEPQTSPTPGSGPDSKPAASQSATPANSSSSAQLPAPGDYAKALTILKRDPLT